MVQFQLKNPLVSEVAEVDRQRRKHAVHHQARIEVIAEEGPVGDDQLPSVLDGDGRTRFHRDVRVHVQGCTVRYDHMAVHVGVFGPCLGGGDGVRIPSRGWSGSSQRS